MYQKDFISHYKNDDGMSLWIFKFNYVKKLGFFYLGGVKDPFPVYEGKMFFFELPNNINEWLLTEWNKATESLDIPSLYLSKPTQMQYSTKVTRLTNNYCPVCLLQKSYFENHHCIARSEGGPDGYKNVLRICATCHAIITRGCLEERWPMDNAALFHQMMNFSLDFYPREFRKIDYKDYEVENRRKTELESFLRTYDNKIAEDKDKLYNKGLEVGKYFYQFYRDIVRGVWSWKNAAKLFPSIYKEFKEVNLIKN